MTCCWWNVLGICFCEASVVYQANNSTIMSSLSIGDFRSCFIDCLPSETRVAGKSIFSLFYTNFTLVHFDTAISQLYSGIDGEQSPPRATTKSYYRRKV